MSRIAMAIGLMGALLVGCGQGQTSGQTQTTTLQQDFDQDAMAALPVGTTKAEVRKKFGAPREARVDDFGSEVWTYVHTDDLLPVGTTQSEGEEADLDQRVTQAPSLTTLDRQEATIKMGPYVTKRARLRFRDGKLVKAEVVFFSSSDFAEQRATVDADGNVTIILDEKAAAD